MRSASCLSICVAALGSGCAATHGPPGSEHDASSSGADAARDASEPSTCASPAMHCCCEGDVVHAPICGGDGRWRCERGSYHTGRDCSWECGTPCSLPCPPDAGALPICEGPGAFHATADRSCASAADCVAATFRIDCCGTMRSTGVAARAADAFARDAAACDARFPDCECLAGPTQADDGSAAMGEPAVVCLGGACATTFADD